jgi:hypothetical protein
LFCPKYCAHAGELRSIAMQQRSVTTRRRIVFMRTSGVSLCKRYTMAGHTDGVRGRG